jgi:hypothetical protein
MWHMSILQANQTQPPGTAVAAALAGACMLCIVSRRSNPALVIQSCLRTSATQRMLSSDEVIRKLEVMSQATAVICPALCSSSGGVHEPPPYMLMQLHAVPAMLIL